MEQMRTARALGAAPTPKDCDALGDKKTCKKADKKKVQGRSIEKHAMQGEISHNETRYLVDNERRFTCTTFTARK